MTEDPRRREDELIEQIAHEVHEFASLLRAAETGEAEVDLWNEVYGEVRLPRGMTAAAAAATGDIISTKYAAAAMIARELAHRVALLEGVSIVEILDDAERKIAEAAARATGDE
ncbi:hypothetical protein AB0B66_10145 [Catellatospora sp. NPDC049111]|uniref:hypothetical protein n=1 Tax=Catellatospora sp. NPDC049111 TaxID=3155271 RepID=UPI0034082D33